jgi:formylglycine-generating enzyme required for sulfatase activity
MKLVFHGMAMFMACWLGASGQASEPSDVPGMVLIPAGEFWMGCNPEVDDQCERDEKKGRRMRLESYFIDKTEVTVEAYTRCVDAGKCTRPHKGNYSNFGAKRRQKHPVNYVDWQQARAYCRWVGKRLPSEAEWEKAARGEDGRKYPWGNQEAGCTHVVYSDDGHGCGRMTTWPVCSKEPGRSPYGLCDMAGNVYEWTEDIYAFYPSPDQPAPAHGKKKNFKRSRVEGQYRVLRGGSWASSLKRARSSNRYRFAPDRWNLNIGFRCALSVTGNGSGN